MVEKQFVIHIDEQLYAGENEETTHLTSGGGWNQVAKQASGIKLVDKFEDAKIIESYTNLNSHWKRIYEALRYGDLEATHIVIEKLDWQ